MRFLADMGVAQRIVEWLRTEGHEAVHLREEGLQRMPNGEIFKKAASEGRIILTFRPNPGTPYLFRCRIKYGVPGYHKQRLSFLRKQESRSS